MSGKADLEKPSLVRHSSPKITHGANLSGSRGRGTLKKRASGSSSSSPKDSPGRKKIGKNNSDSFSGFVTDERLEELSPIRYHGQPKHMSGLYAGNQSDSPSKFSEAELVLVDQMKVRST